MCELLSSLFPTFSLRLRNDGFTSMMSSTLQRVSQPFLFLFRHAWFCCVHRNPSQVTCVRRFTLHVFIIRFFLFHCCLAKHTKHSFASAIILFTLHCDSKVGFALHTTTRWCIGVLITLWLGSLLCAYHWSFLLTHTALQQWVFRHCIQNSMAAMLACCWALSTEWLAGKHVLCELHVFFTQNPLKFVFLVSESNDLADITLIVNWVCSRDTGGMTSILQ